MDLLKFKFVPVIFVTKIQIFSMLFGPICPLLHLLTNLYQSPVNGP